MACKRTYGSRYLPLLCLLTLLSQCLADGDDGCPQQLTASQQIYSPFVPWWHYFSGSNQQCWSWASCTFSRADPARTQQFAATALVMGLIPLTFKDIAWPGRRIILLSRPIPNYVEIIVRGLGMEPKWLDTHAEHKEEIVKAWWAESELAVWTWNKAWLCTIISAASLAFASTAIALTEIYSKRSALGCPYPVFVLSWFVAGFLPALAHSFFSRMRKRRERRKVETMFGNINLGQDHLVKTISAVQGGDEWWIVQLIWAIYYIAGTLIFTSIMAVTVIELLVWVLTSAGMTAASKLLAFYICLLLERQYRPKPQQNSLMPVNADEAVKMAKAMSDPESVELMTR
ncbi:hypothetical protein H2198_000070 [Neophaeococcomyces mojaviensis]|uniref:Uncharacterized protein n=1 Tax=Neophaeococcomyces mojaviensis TaxID=3383035 RepID=A0ACC3AL97_9EURO|nr:hypothetical protein H2198_000070 [Knufia sp. JES_112]